MRFTTTPVGFGIAAQFPYRRVHNKQKFESEVKEEVCRVVCDEDVEQIQKYFLAIGQIQCLHEFQNNKAH